MSFITFLCRRCWPREGMYLLKHRFLFKSFVFHASINFQFYDTDTCSLSLLVYHSREKFVLHSHLRALYKKWIIWVQSNLCSSQWKTIEAYSQSEHLFMWKIAIQSSTVHKYFELNIVHLKYLATRILFDWTVHLALFETATKPLENLKYLVLCMTTQQ